MARVVGSLAMYINIRWYETQYSSRKHEIKVPPIIFTNMTNNT